MTWAIVKPRSAWIAQAKNSLGGPGATGPQEPALRALAAIDHDNFALLIEALAALMPEQVSQELQDLAGLRPVGEVLGMPELGDATGGDDDAWDW